MILKIEYNSVSLKGQIVAQNIPIYIWNRVKDFVLAIQPDAEILTNTISLNWSSILSIATKIDYLRKQHNFKIEYGIAAKEKLKAFRAEYLNVRSAEGTLVNKIPYDEIQQSLDNLGWGNRRLTKEQLRDTSLLISRSHGANFSVPGAGKTTVAFATHLLTKTDDTILMVVAPKNAFSAWDDVIKECLNLKNPQADLTSFIRLAGSIEEIEEIIASNSKRLLINYEKLVRIFDTVSKFLSTNKLHLILDESHRMKAGERSQRGSTLLSLAHLPVRKDILSGTPIPRSIEDIAPQIDFLWTGQGIGSRIIITDKPYDILKGIYVRTTKQELNLPPRYQQAIQIEMKPAQLALYGLLRQEALNRMAGIKSNSNVNIKSARKSVIRLLQVSSNPILAVQGMTLEDPEDFSYNDPKIQAVFNQVIAEGDSNKIVESSRLAREFAINGEKCVIWTSFTRNVERIAELLSDVGATFIHGGVETGSEDDISTREGRIKNFNNSKSDCMVLVANPAACSEGISLHKVCHKAIYVDRTFNAGHHLQSIDRIHRLGLDPDVVTNIYILESVAPGVTGAIDFSIRRRLIDKLRLMSDALNDSDLQALALDEEEGDQPIDFDITLDDLKDIIDELSGIAPVPGEED